MLGYLPTNNVPPQRSHVDGTARTREPRNGRHVPPCCTQLDCYIFRARRDPKSVAQTDDEARFDRMRRELTFAAKGAPGERTRTAEELADLERLRLEVKNDSDSEVSVALPNVKTVTRRSVAAEECLIWSVCA